ncbi:MAG: dodecin family protein [Chloroflexaceae bacterium]
MSAESVYKVVEIVGTSPESWEKAATVAMMTAARSLRDIRVAEVVAQDIHLDGETIIFRTKIKLSFKYHEDE